MTVTLKESNHDAQIVLRTMIQGLNDIASQYPAHLTVLSR